MVQPQPPSLEHSTDPQPLPDGVLWKSMAGTGGTTLSTMERPTDTQGLTPVPTPPGQSLVPALTILYHRDLQRIGERALLGELALGAEAALSRAEPLFAPPGGSGGVPLSDTRLSRQPVRLVPVEGGIRLDPSQTRTRVGWQGQAVAAPRTFTAAEVEGGVVLALSDAVVLVLHLATPSWHGDVAQDFGLIGDNHVLQGVRREVRRTADLDTPVLVRGETGTGKEVVARALHDCSRRASGPFVAVNLGAVPPSLAAAELFGVERGAFTGADRRQAGYFNLARGGTLFLDEVGEAPPEVQVLLLRAIETGEIHALGAGPAQRVPVRIVAATDANLEARMRDGSFRQTLFHRLAGKEIMLPPLRRRREDIGRLFLHFLRTELARTGEEQLLGTGPAATPWLLPSLMAQLGEYDWPGNVRQLRNVAQQIAVARRGGACDELGAAVERWLDTPLPPVTASRPPVSPVSPVSMDHRTDETPSEPVPATFSGFRKPGEVTGDELVEALRACRWDLKATAHLLRISRTSLYALLERAPHIRLARDLSPEEIRRCHEECQGDLDAMVQRLQVSRRALQRRLRELHLL